ncbi:MAG TPA: molybdopterin-synthase adenylyltransferase MoeB [Vicinamibacterales bacterium]|nr:molybdopterin-synthase adenylyltransferase MoeB [Vicinamibacterales bacterium]
MSLSPDELLRYSRHTLLPEFGMKGQTALKSGRVLIVGAGGLGSPAALYLAAAGVGTIGIVDFDAVDETNLQRQILYGTPDVGQPKVAVAASRLREANPHIAIEEHAEALDASNAVRLISDYDVVLDGTDNFSTRYLVNDACVMARRPNVYGSVFRFEGQVSVFGTPGGPCYRCLHPEPPPAGLIPNCAEAGVLGVLPGVIGTLQATEAIKVLTGVGEPLAGRLLLYDALRMRFRQIVLPRDPACPMCGDAPTIREVQAYDPGVCEAGAGSRNPALESRSTMEPAGFSPRDSGSDDMTVDELIEWRRDARPHVLIDVREPSEHATSRIEGARLIPLRQLQSQVSTLPKDRPVVVHCAVGGRSAIAVAMLKVQGFDARNLSGGIRAWQARAPADI